jgi:SAM-dependent methyltransferase
MSAVSDTGENPTEALPPYDEQLSAFHRVFARELEGIIAALPLDGGMRVLDLACGDGFYTRRLAERLGPDGHVTGVDINQAYLSRAREEAARRVGGAAIDFVSASFDALPFPAGAFDVVWCAQSLYSLPDPVVVLGHLARVLRPGGLVVVLENDTLHQVLLPWPVDLELHLRAAELRAFLDASHKPGKYYVGRRLPAVLASAGLEPLGRTTYAFDRHAPLSEPERALLQRYLEEVAERVTPYLDEPLHESLRRLVEPGAPQHLPAQPHLTMTWLSMLAVGRKPGPGG